MFFQKPGENFQKTFGHPDNFMIKLNNKHLNKYNRFNEQFYVPQDVEKNYITNNGSFFIVT